MTAESPEQIDWECCVCYKSGTRMEQVLLKKCSHSMCVACFNGIIDASPHSKKDYIKCLRCHVDVPIASEPSRWTEAHMRNWAEWLQENRQIMKNIEGMLSETNDEERKEILTDQLEDIKISFPNWMNTLKDMADDWGQWEKYEALTHNYQTA